MHLAFLVHDIHLGGGGERVTVNLTNALLAKGYQVSVISMSVPDPSRPVFSLNPLANVHYLHTDSGMNIVDKTLSLWKLNFFLRKQKYDFVLGVGNYPSLLLSLTMTGNRIRKIGCMHLSFKAVPKVWSLLATLFFRRLNALVSLTHHDKPLLERLNPNVFVIPNATSFQTEKQALLDQKVVLALGRFVDEKDFATMIDLFGIFCRSDKDWILRIRGEGPLKDDLHKQVEQLGLFSNVQILPATGNVESEYLGASVFLLTSKYEGLPMVLIEAQSFGVPVISFDCETGPAEIIVDSVSGYLVSPDNKEELVTRLIELTSDSAKRKEMGRQAKLNAKRFSQESIIKSWEDMFHVLKN